MSAGIHELARTGKTELLELELKKEGVDINLKDKDEYTPLHLAAINGHSECVGILLESGANATLTDKNGRTALHWAAMKEHGICLAYLLHKAGKDIISLRDNDDCTALNLANKNGNEGAICSMLLLGYKTDPSFCQLPSNENHTLKTDTVPQYWGLEVNGSQCTFYTLPSANNSTKNQSPERTLSLAPTT